MWSSLISKAKDGGIDVIQTYVFWNLHEPQIDQYNFDGRADIVRFIKEIQAQGLYACIRIGPFIQSEWNYGGFPFWLRGIPDIVFRSDNEPFKFHMERFTRKIVDILKSEQLFASQGGPIILSQIENEYKLVEESFGEKGPSYIRWAAGLAVRLQTGVPWVMCKQDDAPDPVINACNGKRCGTAFQAPNSPNKPSIWTENWTSFYQTFGEEADMRSAEDIAFQVALFIAKKGSFVNYYMYHGGTNFGRTAAAYMLTSYYDQAPLDEYGLIRQPKWGHLKELHAAIKLCSESLLSGENSTLSLGQHQQAYVFRGEKCSAFLVNTDDRTDATVLFQNISYSLPRNSISIVPDCKIVAFNTAKVRTQHDTRSMRLSQKFDSLEKWEEYKEIIPSLDETSLRANTLLEHVNTTKDVSDYLWYTSSLQHDSTNAQYGLGVNSHGHVLHVFVNGVFVGSAHGSHNNTNFSLQNAVSLKEGMNNVSLLSVLAGLPDSGPFLESRIFGLRRVVFQGNNEVKDITNSLWGYQVGLVGENLQVYTDHGSSKVVWSKLGTSNHQPLTWYKIIFDAPAGNDPLALNLASMGKGQAWVNEQSIGRYWVSFHTPQGNPSQTWYNVPRSFLKPTGNLLVLLEEEQGWPPEISIDTISISKVCGHVTDSHLPPVTSWEGQTQNHERKPKVELGCPWKRKISKVLFASFGTPSGNCQSYAVGSCHSVNSRTIVEKACLGKRRCSIPHSLQNFGADPCRGVPKSLLIEVQCT